MDPLPCQSRAPKKYAKWIYLDLVTHSWHIRSVDLPRKYANLTWPSNSYAHMVNEPNQCGLWKRKTIETLQQRVIEMDRKKIVILKSRGNLHYNTVFLKRVFRRHNPYNCNSQVKRKFALSRWKSELKIINMSYACFLSLLS